MYTLIKAYYELIAPNLYVIDGYLPYLPVLFDKL